MVFQQSCTDDSWTIKKAERRRIDAFELWCWRRLLRVPRSVRRSKQSILKKFNTEYSLEWLMLKLKLQYFGHLMGRTDSFEKTLMLGKIEGGRRRGWQRMRWLMVGWHHRVDGHNFEQDPGVGDGMLQSMGLQSRTWLSDWTEPNLNIVQRGFTFLKAKLNM